MPLPSQTARLTSGRSPMFRKRSRSPKPLLLLGGAVAVLIGLWWLAGVVGAPGGVEQPLIQVSEQPQAGTQPLPAASEAAPAEPTFPPPTLISLGSLGASPAGEPERVDPKPDFTPPAPAVTETPRTDPARAPVAATAPPPDPAPAAPVRETPALEETPAAATAQGTADSLLPADLLSLIGAGREKLTTDPVAARRLLTRALVDARAPEPERSRMRDEIAKLNDELVFSPRAAKDDPFVLIYAVQSGDALEKIAKKNGLNTHWRLIQRVNRLANPNRVQLNQKLKLVKGPFHAVVIKSAYRMDVYMGDQARPQDWVYVRSFRIGLGEGNSTPTGDFIVKRGSKLENPYWTNPRTGEQFSKDDPKNPIGERWVGLEGLGESAANTGYGIHGTIDPDSIGQQRSMGCVRLGSEDVELVYDLLGEGVSLVRIVP